MSEEDRARRNPYKDAMVKANNVFMSGFSCLGIGNLPPYNANKTNAPIKKMKYGVIAPAPP